MFKSKEEFYKLGVERGYSKEEILKKEQEYYNRGYSFANESTLAFRPNEILNQAVKMPEIVGQQLDEQFAEIDDTNVVRQYYGAKNNIPARQIMDGSVNQTIDLNIREENNIDDDKPIPFQQVRETLKQEHSKPEDDDYFDLQGTISQYVSLPKGKPPSGYIEPEFALRDVFFLSGERAFQEDALEGNLDVEYDEAGVPVKGSGGIVGSTRYGTYNVGLSQRIMENVLQGDREQVQQLIENDKIIQERVGSAYDYSDLNYFNPKRGGMMALQSAGMMAENSILGLAGSASTAFAGGVGGTVAVTSYNQQLGAGDMMKEYLYDKDVINMPDDEYRRAAEIAMTVGVPFALIELGINIPFVRGTGFGTAVLRPIKRKIMNKLMKQPELVQRIAAGGVDAAYRIIVEVSEEGGQFAAQEIGGQGMESLDPETPYLKEIQSIVTNADYKKVGTGIIDTMVQALPAVVVMGGASATVEAVFSRKYLDDFAEDIKKAQSSNDPEGETFKVYRKAAVEKLTTMGLAEDLADDLVDQAIYAETTEEVQDVISKTQSALFEANQSFNNVGLRVLTNADWNSFAKFMSEEQQREFVQMFPEIQDDFVAGVNGDTDAQNRYNAFVKNNQDAQYLDFLIKQNVQEKSKDQPRGLSEKTKDEILNTNIHDEKVEKFRKEGESLDDTKLRLVYDLENRGDPFIRERIANIRKSLLRLMPNLQIIVAENDEQYLKLTGLEKASAGVYNNGRIILNEKRVNKTTIAHEAFHALLDNYLGVDTFDTAINTILDNALKVASPELVARIEAHRDLYSDYSEIGQREEMIAELAGILSATHTELPSTRKGIKGFKDRLLGLAGLKTKSMADKEVIDMFNSVVQGFSTGQTLAETQVETVFGTVNTKNAKRQVEQRNPLSEEFKEAIKTHATSKERKLGQFYAQRGNYNPVTDYELLKEAIRISEIKKVDPQQYKSPADLIDKFAGEVKAKPINPNNVPELGEKTELDQGFEMFEVSDDLEMQPIVRNFVDTHWGEETNPWCITQVDTFDIEKVVDRMLADYGRMRPAGYGERQFSFFTSRGVPLDDYIQESFNEIEIEINSDKLTKNKKRKLVRNGTGDFTNTLISNLNEKIEAEASIIGLYLASSDIRAQGAGEYIYTLAEEEADNVFYKISRRARQAYDSADKKISSIYEEKYIESENAFEVNAKLTPSQINEIENIFSAVLTIVRDSFNELIEEEITSDPDYVKRNFLELIEDSFAPTQRKATRGTTTLYKIKEIFGSIKTGKRQLTQDSENYWKQYPNKQIVFKKGKLHAFGSEGVFYDRVDQVIASPLPEFDFEFYGTLDVSKNKSIYINTEDGKIFAYEVTTDIANKVIIPERGLGGLSLDSSNLEESEGRVITSEELQELSEKYDNGVTFERYEFEISEAEADQFERGAELYADSPKLRESKLHKVLYEKESAKEQRSFSDDELNEFLNSVQGGAQTGKGYLNQTIDDYNEMRQKWDLSSFNPSDIISFEEQTAQAVKEFGIVEDSNHPDFGNFNVDYFMQSVMSFIYELKEGQKLPSLNSTEQAAVTLAISLLDKRVTQLSKEIEIADGEGRGNYTNRLINERGSLVNQIERYSNLLIRARSDAGRLLGSHRNTLKEDYSLANILYRVAKITGTTQTSEANVEYFSKRANELNEIEERKERLETQLDSEYETYYDEQVDDYFEYTYNNPPKGILDKAKKAIKDISNRAGKFFGKFGGKEQRIPDSRFRGGVLDTDNYVDRPEVLCARLAELFIIDDVRDGKPLDKDSIINRIKRVLEQDGQEFSVSDIKKAIAENTLKQYDLRKQYVAFLSLLKISATLEEDLSKAASKIFDADKKVRANSEDAIAMEATLDKLVAHFDALLNTVNTIYDKRMVKELRKRIETLRQLSDDITSPKISQKRKSKAVTKAQEELKLLKQKQKTKKRIQELQKIIDEGSYDAILLKRKKKESKYDKEMLDLMATERRLKNEIAKKIAILEAQQEGRLKRILRDSFLLPRTLKAMADMSAALNQAIMYLGKDPVAWTKTFVRGFGVFFNAKYADKMDGLTRAISRDFGLDNYGIELTSTEGQLSQKEEVFLTEFFNLPIIKQTIGKLVKDPSERHYVNFLNRMRVDMCVGFIKRHPNATSQEIIEWVEFVNLASGRGKIGRKFDNALPFLGNIFFAPRLTASRFKLPYYSIAKIAKNAGKGRGVATEIADTWIRFGTTYGVMALLAVLNGWKFEDDPEDSDYAKLRKGNLVLNPLGGFQQVARVHHLLAKEAINIKTDEQEGGFSIRPISRMLKWKLNPIFSFVSEVGMNKNWVTGAELDDNQPIFGLDTSGIPVVSDSRFRSFIYNITPITVEGWAESLDEQQEAGEIMSQLAPDFFGLSSSYYEDRTPSEKKQSSSSFINKMIK